MNLRRAIVEFVAEGREIIARLRSEEANDIEDSELHILRVQLFQIDNIAANLQELKRPHPSKTMATAEVEEELPRLEEPSIFPEIMPPAEPA